jgi:hypothetical protein
MEQAEKSSEQLFLPYVRQKAQKFRVGRVSRVNDSDFVSFPTPTGGS